MARFVCAAYVMWLLLLLLLNGMKPSDLSADQAGAVTILREMSNPAQDSDASSDLPQKRSGSRVR